MWKHTDPGPASLFRLNSKINQNISFLLSQFWHMDNTWDWPYPLLCLISHSFVIRQASCLTKALPHFHRHFIFQFDSLDFHFGPFCVCFIENEPLSSFAEGLNSTVFFFSDSRNVWHGILRVVSLAIMVLSWALYQAACPGKAALRSTHRVISSTMQRLCQNCFCYRPLVWMCGSHLCSCVFI